MLGELALAQQVRRLAIAVASLSPTGLTGGLLGPEAGNRSWSQTPTVAATITSDAVPQTNFVPPQPPTPRRLPQPDSPSFADFLSAISAENSSRELPVVPVTSNPQTSAAASVDALTTTAPAIQSQVGRTPVGEPWWQARSFDYLLDSPSFLQFDLATILADTLQSSPRVSAISKRTSIAYEEIVQQDAVFDPAILLESGINRVNDPVGSTLTTGGPSRLIQDAWNAEAGVRKRTRQGTVIDVKQQIGTLTSNSLFFDPKYQGNSRLSLSITQPLLATSGRVYNTRLLTAATIESHIAWQHLRLDLENHLVETLTAFWRLHERRSHLVQQIALIERGQHLGDLVRARADFDSGPLQRVKITRRLASDNDRLIELRSEVQRLQVRLKTLVGSPMLASIDDSIELIPTAEPNIPDAELQLRDCIVRGLEHRPDIQAATQHLASAGLEVDVTRNELLPRLNAVMDAYLSSLAGDNDIGQAWVDQYASGGPGVTAALTYNLPWGRRAAKSRHREARYRYQQRADELQEALLTARREIESAVIRVRAGAELRRSKAQTLAAAMDEETIATRRWETLAGDGGPTALILEDLLETQKRRADAEQQFVSAQVNYVLDLVALQQAMGTFLIREGIEPLRPMGHSGIEILQTPRVDFDLPPQETWDTPLSEPTQPPPIAASVPAAAFGRGAGNGPTGPTRPGRYSLSRSHAMRLSMPRNKSQAPTAPINS